MSDGECRFTVRLHWLDYYRFTCSLRCVISLFSLILRTYGTIIKTLYKNLVLHIRPDFTSPPLSRQAIRGRSANTLLTSLTILFYAPSTTAACCINLFNCRFSAYMPRFFFPSYLRYDGALVAWLRTT